MKPPDIYEDAAQLLAKDAYENRFDRMKRERLLPRGDWPSPVTRQHPLSFATRLLVTKSRLAFWLFWTHLFVTLFLAPVARIYGAGLFSPVTYPIIFFGGALAAYYRFSRKG